LNVVNVKATSQNREFKFGVFNYLVQLSFVMVRDKKKRSVGVSFNESVVDNAASSSSSSRSKRSKSAPTELEQEEAAALDKLTSTDIKGIMSGDMAEVACVLLKQDGSEQELTLDMTPRLKKTQETLGGQITFMGQWEDMEVILVINAEAQEEEDTAKLNKHKLQPPFHDAEVYGDILLMRSDEGGNPKALPLADYDAFKKLDIKEWSPEEEDDDDDESSEEEEAAEEEEDDEPEYDEDDEEDEEGDGELEAMYLEVLKKKVVEQYKAVHGKEPTEEEADDLARRLMGAISQVGPAEGEGEDEDENENEDEGDGDPAPPANIFGFGK